MKKFLFYLVIPFVFWASSCSGPEKSSENPSQGIAIDSPDGIAEAVLTCLSSKDYTSLSELIISKEEIGTVLKKSSLSEEDKEKGSKGIDERLKNILAGTKRSFDETISAVESEGILWNEAKFKKSEYQIRKENEIESMDLGIIFEFKGIEYPISCKDVIKTENGWKLAGGILYDRTPTEEEKRKMEDDARRIADSLANAINEAVQNK